MQNQNNRPLRRRRGNAPRSVRAPSISTIPSALSLMSVDPPTVRANPPRNAVLFGNAKTTEDGIFLLGNTDVTVLINDQLYGGGIGSSVPLFYQVSKIAAWAPGSTSNTISVQDTLTGITSIDSGSFMRRAKAGIFYPAPSRITQQSAGATLNLATITLSPGGGDIDYRVHVKTWARSNLE